MANYCAFVRMVVIAIFLVATTFTKNALAIDSCSVVSGCPTGDAALGVNFTGLQPSDLSAGSFNVSASSGGGFSCEGGGGIADNNSSCTAHFNSSNGNIECLIEHIDCRNNPFSISVSAPSGYSCSPDPSSVSLANCSDNSPITVNCTTPAPVCIPDGSCSAPTPACGETTEGIDNCKLKCTKTGPACPVDGSSCTAISVNNGNAVTSGQSYSATVSMQNPAGNFTTWTTNAGYKLGSSNPRDNTVWGLSRVALPSTITPGNTATFNFDVTAPAVTSQTANTFYWEMLREGVDWFGAQCQYNVTVNPAAAPAQLSTNNCTGTPDPGQTGQNITWNVNGVSGGNGTYTYSWTGTDSLSNTTSNTTATSNSTNKTYTTTGTKNASVTISSGTATSITKDCSITITAPVSFDFNLTNGGDKTVSRGSSVNNSVIATLSSGATQSVSFSALGFPSGVTHSFSPTSCNPACSSTLNMAASQTAPTGSPTITVTGTAGSLTKTTTFTLTVATPPASCGNGTCSGGESCSTCTSDCGICPAPPPPTCGNGVCSGGETCSTCSQDCGVCPIPPPPSSANCPWIQTTGGDVHSNTSINTPCGP